MLNKKFIALVCLALATGLVVGLVSFRDEFEVWSSYTAEVDVVHVYFHVLNVSQDSGIGFERIVAYIVVLNITNPTGKIFELRELRMSFGANESNLVMSYYRDFESGHSDYYWQPGSSRLVAFSATSGIADWGMKVLNSHEGYFSVDLLTGGLGEQGNVRATSSKKLQLKALGDNEFVYGTEFKAGNYFVFLGDPLDIIEYGNGRVG